MFRSSSGSLLLLISTLLWSPAEATAESLVLASSVHHLDSLAFEPMVVEHPDGTLFLTGFSRSTDPEEPPQLWKSGDRGASWARVSVGTRAQGAGGNSDPDLAVASDGTLYLIALGFDRTKSRGTHVAVGATRDRGESWTWTRLSQGKEEDRPWIEVAPDGTAHAIWNDASGGVRYAVSADRGESWEARERIHPVGGSSHLAVGPGGEVAVRIAPLSWGGYRFDAGVDLVAVSADAGRTWSKRDAPGARDWVADAERTPDTPEVPRWAEPLAWDSAGALYHLWSAGATLHVARSRDRGESWTIHEVTRSLDPMFYPYMVAGGRGILAAVWFAGRMEGYYHAGANELALRAGRFEFPSEGDASPRVFLSEPFLSQTWNRAATPPARTVGGDYVPVVLLSDGSVGAVTPIQDAAADRWGFTFWRFTSGALGPAQEK
jgi:hypothetical protein